jgi:serine/threonine protein kinase
MSEKEFKFKELLDNENIVNIKIDENKTIKFKFLKAIGKGAKGQGIFNLIKIIVSLIELMESDHNGLYALKKITPDENDIDKVEEEILILKKLNHENIIKYIDCFEKKTKSGFVNINIITEYCNGGNLESVLQKCCNNLDYSILNSDNLTKWMIQLIDAILYLHQKGIIHRDIKPPNILFTIENNTKYIK